MALIAGISITSRFDQLVPNQKASVTVVVQNTGASSVTLTSIDPVVTPIDAGFAVGPCSIPVGQETIAAGARAFYTFGFIPFAPQDVASPATVSYTVGVTVRTSDTIVVAPTQAVTVRQPDASPPGSAGYFKFDSSLNSGLPFFW